MALFVGFGFCGVTVVDALFFTSLAYTSVQHAATLMYTAPALVAILSWLVLREQLSHARIVAVLFAVAGAFLVLGVTKLPLLTLGNQLGHWLALSSGVVYSFSFIFGKVLCRKHEPAFTSFFTLFIGMLLLLPVMFALEGFRLPQRPIA